ncbi:AraC family transcriptional regulator [Nocardioides aestuarii]|uniref:AraC family transcriptional regulator n=1 Tax=Nocardioides aestuarii TaxID=252231 RepID=A0ABW4TNK4_9ACTN
MIAELNGLVDEVERAGVVDVAGYARRVGTTDHHLRRMFSSLAGMPLSVYVRRRRLTLAATDLVAGDDDLLTIAVRHGYGSHEAFNRAFRAVHGASPGDVRRDGGPLRSQPQLRFRLTVEGSTPMDTRIVDRPALRVAGHATRVPLQHEGENTAIAAFVAAIPPEEHQRLKALSYGEPGGLLSVTVEVEQDAAEGSELTYLHGVAVSETTAVEGLDVIEVPAGRWVVFTSSGPHPEALQRTWAATATDWFPSNPWRLRPGPSLVAYVERADDFSTATTELWMPVEPA